MQIKPQIVDVPGHSTYVHFSHLTLADIESWHEVYWPAQSTQKDEQAYAYADANFRHAWTVNDCKIWFADHSEAVQFALMFGS